MDIEVVFDTKGFAPAGVDREVLIADIQAELDKLTSKAGVGTVQPTHKQPPDGAQGDIASLHWLLHIATDPAMAKVYAQGLLYALNALLGAARSKQNEDSDRSAQTPPEKLSINIRVLGKEIVLPAAAAVIKSILDQIGSN